jgi:hypothetical protein
VATTRLCITSAQRLIAGVILAGGVAVSLPGDARAQVSDAVLAQLLGGSLPTDEVPAEARLNLAAYERYQERMDAAWSAYDTGRGELIRHWSQLQLAGVSDEHVFYPFSGPDFVTAQRFYPGAERYIMVAMQIAGRPPELDRDTLRSDDIFSTFAQGADAFQRNGFFVTADLYEEFQDGDAVEGITGMLMLMADRTGYEVVTVEPVRADENGDVEVVPETERTARSWASVRLNMVRRADEQPVTLDYLRLNLSDTWLRAHDGDAAFITNAAAGHVVIKAASHMPQRGWFNLLNDAIATTAHSVLQDETGLPWELLTQHMSVRLFGEYLAPNRLFPEAPHQTLIDAYAVADPEVLPFEYGYDKPAGSCLVLAVRPAE